MIDRDAKVPITARAVELFQRALAIKAGGNTRRREFLDLQLALHRGLDLQLLHPFPLDLEADQPPPSWMTDAHQIACWNHVADLRRRLDAAVERTQRKQGT
jgi:hypothetical protein